MAEYKDKNDKKLVLNESNNFFNLESDEDDDDHPNKTNQDELNQKIKKWDWDKEENRHLYYNQKTISKPSDNKNELKRPSENHQAYNDNDKEEECCAAKKPLYDASLMMTRSSSKHPYIETLSNDEIDWTNSNRSESKLKYNLVGHCASVNRINWGKRLDHKNFLLSSSMDGKIIIWDLSNKRAYKSNNYSGQTNNLKVITGVHSKSIRNAIWSKSELEVISVSYDQTCSYTSIESGKIVNRFRHKNILSAVSTFPNDENLILIGSKNEILVWDVRAYENKPVKVFRSQMCQVQDILFLNENEFASCGDVTSKDSAEYSIQVWDFSSTACLSNQIFHEKYICTQLKKHPNNSLFYAQTHGDYIAEFSTRTPYKMNKYKRFESKGHQTHGYSIGFDLNQTGSLLATGSTDGCVYVYNSQTSKLFAKINAFNNQLIRQPCMDAKFQLFSNPAAFNASNDVIDHKQYLAVSSLNGQIKIYEL